MAHVSIGSTFGYLNEQKQTRNPFKNKKEKNLKIQKSRKSQNSIKWDHDRREALSLSTRINFSSLLSKYLYKVLVCIF